MKNGNNQDTMMITDGSIREGIFLSRRNRFTAQVLVDGETILCHIHNTGRLQELFVEGAVVLLKKAENANRKTSYDLIAVRKGSGFVSVDSYAPNRAAGIFLRETFGTEALIKPEAAYHQSRFDFYVETNSRRIFLEVKGVTLEKDGIALFPDAPTARGVKHLTELCDCVDDGYEAAVLFVIQFSPVRAMMPNESQDPAFAKALKRAKEKGVHILAYDCDVSMDSLRLKNSVPVFL